MNLRVIFVAGTGRCGSTVFEMAMAESLGVPSTGELVSVWTRGVIENRACSCGEDFDSCPFWQAVVSTEPAMFTKQVATRVSASTAGVLHAFGPLRCMTSRLRDGLPERVGPQWFDAMGALYRGVAEATGSPTFTDSSKAPVIAILLSRIEGLQVDMVHLTRDPRDVARSWKHPHAVGPHTAPMPRLAPWKSAITWLLVNAAAGRAGASLSGACSNLRYEDFVDEPSRQINRVSGELGLGHRSLDPERPVMVGVSPHSMSGNPPVRLRREPVRIAAQRPPAGGLCDFLVVSGLCWPLLHRWGYRLRADR